MCNSPFFFSFFFFFFGWVPTLPPSFFGGTHNTRQTEGSLYKLPPRGATDHENPIRDAAVWEAIDWPCRGHSPQWADDVRGQTLRHHLVKELQGSVPMPALATSTDRGVVSDDVGGGHPGGPSGGVDSACRWPRRGGWKFGTACDTDRGGWIRPVGGPFTGGDYYGMQSKQNQHLFQTSIKLK